MKYAERKLEMERLTAAKEDLLTTGSKEKAERAIGLSGLSWSQCVMGVNERLRSAIGYVQAGHRMPARTLKEAQDALRNDTSRCAPVKWVVASVSSNRNSFGLAGVTIISQLGEAWELGMSQPPAKGTKFTGFITRPEREDLTRYAFDAGVLGTYEIPRRLRPDAPADVLKELFA